MIEIREERPGDQAAIHRLNEAAFGQPLEANIVDQLRTACSPLLSLVAISDNAVVGHILFSPVTLRSGAVEVQGMGVAPMAVDSAHQRKGIGSRLVRAGLERLRLQGCPFVIVLGHPDYYPRFGFEPASAYGVRSQWDGVPDGAFMITVFDKAGLPQEGGTAWYRAEFDAAV